MEGVHWYLQCYTSTRGEAVDQIVVKRVAAVCRASGGNKTKCTSGKPGEGKCVMPGYCGCACYGGAVG